MQPFPAIAKYLFPPPAISSHLQPSPAISSNLQPSPAISTHLYPSPAISSHLQPTRDPVVTPLNLPHPRWRELAPAPPQERRGPRAVACGSRCLRPAAAPPPPPAFHGVVVGRLSLMRFRFPSERICLVFVAAVLRRHGTRHWATDLAAILSRSLSLLQNRPEAPVCKLCRRLNFRRHSRACD